MQQRKIGDLPVSVIGLGTNNFGMAIDADESRRVVEAALEAGINYFDTADMYGGQKSEEFLRAALGKRRDDVLIATKFGHPNMEPPDGRGAAPVWVRKSVEASLRRLGTDRIDHYQLHMPDEQTPMEDTLATLTELVDEGLVREIGCSNFSATQIEEAAAVSAERGLARYVSVQNHYSLMKTDAERDVIPACERTDIAFVPYFPLESGLLTGKYSQGVPPGSRLERWGGDNADALLDEERQATIQRLTEFAQGEGHTILDLAFAWLLAQPRVSTVIAGATKPEQVMANAAAAEWEITTEQRSEAALLATT